MPIARIKFGRNSLTGEIPAQLGNFRHLQTLSLPDNHLTGEIPANLYNCAQLQVLDVGSNQIRGSLEDSALWRLSTLRVLSLGSNRLNGPIPSWIGNFSSDLQVIGLSHNSFSGVVPQHMQLQAFKGGGSTAKFSSQGTLYEDVIQIVMKNNNLTINYVLAALATLDLSSNKLTGSIPSNLGDLSATMSLNLSGNAIGGSIPSSLSNLRNLESLDLSFNSLTGPIPPDFSKLTFIGTFNVSYNQLSGPNPASPKFENPWSYVGNSKLCGSPILKGCCDETPRPPPAEAASTASRKKGGWKAVMGWVDERMSLAAVGVGAAVGFAVVGVGTSLLL